MARPGVGKFTEMKGKRREIGHKQSATDAREKCQWCPVQNAEKLKGREGGEK
jgi:hypothetical protein